MTEVDNYDKYLLDIDKIMHFPITFVVKTLKSKATLYDELEKYIKVRANGMKVIEKRYREAIEEIITINEQKQWLNALDEGAVYDIVRDIGTVYSLEMNLDD